MTMPRKNRRNIVVDMVKYHWSNRSRGAWSEWIFIQQATGRGPLLKLDCCGVPSLPQLAAGIRFALQQGWDPIRGKPCYLGFKDDSPEGSFVVRDAKSGSYWREFIITDPTQWRTSAYAVKPLLKSLSTELYPERNRAELLQYLGPPDKHDPCRDMYMLYFNMPRCIELVIHYSATNRLLSYRLSWVKTEEYGKFLESPDDIPYVQRD
jgi:hypothetical protein